jgi:U3 small nucleolar RNA-associated protein 20
MIRAILSRRIVISEVYDIMTTVASIMVTNQSRSVRESTRALYVQFLMDYPQGRDRLKKQISFLIKNLQYVHETGRQSVMEVFHQIITRFGNEILQPILLDVFVGLLLPMSNDESATCRDMAARLVQSIIENADDERTKSIRTMLKGWAGQTDNPPLLRVSLHVYGILLEHRIPSTTDDTNLCVECVSEIILRSGKDEGDSAVWEVTEQALQLLIKLAKAVPEQVFSSAKEDLWMAIRDLLTCERPLSRLTCSKLVGILFGRAGSLKEGQLKAESLILRVPNLTSLARQFLEQIKSPEIAMDVGLQGVKNLIFLGRHFHETKCILPQTKVDTEVGNGTEVKTCFTWVISRIAAEIRYERAVAEVHPLIST